jgi:hypothetical protein
MNREQCGRKRKEVVDNCLKLLAWSWAKITCSVHITERVALLEYEIRGSHSGVLLTLRRVDWYVTTTSSTQSNQCHCWIICSTDISTYYFPFQLTRPRSAYVCQHGLENMSLPKYISVLFTPSSLRECQWRIFVTYLFLCKVYGVHTPK